MKRLILLLCALGALCLPVCAAELPEELGGAVPSELLDGARDGDDLVARGADYLRGMLGGALEDAVLPALRAAAALMLLSLLCGLVEGTAVGAGEQGTRCVALAGVLGAAALSAGDLSTLIGLGVETVDELFTAAKLLVPTLAAAMAGGGCVSAASAWQVGALAMCEIFLALLRGCFVPALYCMIGAAAAGALLPESRLTLLSEGIGKLLSWALGALLFAFTGFLSLSGLLAGSADRVSVRIGKTVISGAVPVVGGILSDTAEALLAGADALRGTIGTLGIFTVLALCMAPLLRLAAQYVLYRLTAFFCGMTGSEALRGFLEQLSSAFALMLAMTAGGAFVLLAALMIAIRMVMPA